MELYTAVTTHAAWPHQPTSDSPLRAPWPSSEGRGTCFSIFPLLPLVRPDAGSLKKEPQANNTTTTTKTNKEKHTKHRQHNETGRPVKKMNPAHSDQKSPTGTTPSPSWSTVPSSSRKLASCSALGSMGGTVTFLHSLEEGKKRSVAELHADQ